MAAQLDSPYFAHVPPVLQSIRFSAEARSVWEGQGCSRARPALGAQDRFLQVLRPSTARSRSSVPSAKANKRYPWSSLRRPRISCRCVSNPEHGSHFSQRALVPRGFADGN